MSGRKGEMMAARKHRQASHAASCHQTMCCSHLLSGFHRQKQAGKPRSAQAVSLRMSRPEPLREWGWSGDTRSMGLPGLLKGRGLIRLLRLPDGVENTRPDIGQGSDRDGMALALGSFALVIVLRPGFLVRTLPGKLLQGIAPGLDAAQAAMRFLIRPALEEDWRGSRKGLQTAGALVASPIIPQFSQQARSETGKGSRQRLEEVAVGMHQKKAFDLRCIESFQRMRWLKDHHVGRRDRLQRPILPLPMSAMHFGIIQQRWWRLLTWWNLRKNFSISFQQGIDHLRHLAGDTCKFWNFVSGNRIITWLIRPF